MNESYPYRAAQAQQSKSSLKPVLIAVLGAFLLGGAGVYYLVGSDDWSAPELFDLKETGTAPASSGEEQPPIVGPVQEPEEAVAEAVERVEQVVEQQGGLDQRLAAMEQRLTRLDLQAEAATGNVARAEGLLIAFATRRSLERGSDLGYLADQLRLRFGDARPNAVQTVIYASQDPVTLDQLIARLDGLAPVLAQTPANEGTWAWLGREVSQLFVVRNEDTPSPRADRRLGRARTYIETGQIDRAVAEVGNLPNAVEATDWLEDARRYATVQMALEVLETAAIMEPHELRDSAGENVDQISPVSGASSSSTSGG